MEEPKIIFTFGLILALSAPTNTHTTYNYPQLTITKWKAKFNYFHDKVYYEGRKKYPRYRESNLLNRETRVKSF